MSRTVRVHWTELTTRSAIIETADDLGDLTDELRMELVERAQQSTSDAEQQQLAHLNFVQDVTGGQQAGPFIPVYPDLPEGEDGDEITCPYVTVQADIDTVQRLHDEQVAYMRELHGDTANLPTLVLPELGDVCGREVLYDEQRWEYSPLREWTATDDDRMAARLGDSRSADSTHGWALVACEAGHEWNLPREFDYGF